MQNFYNSPGFTGETDVFSIGKTWLGRDITCLRLGLGRKKVLLVGGIRAGDGAITELLKKTVDIFSGQGRNQGIPGLNIPKLFSSVRLYVIPELNPDGRHMRLSGVGDGNPLAARCRRMNGGSDDFSAWQSNARGVDLMHNFDGGWLDARKLGNAAPGISGYAGEYPESERESLSLRLFSASVRPDIVCVLSSGPDTVLSVFPGSKKARLAAGCMGVSVSDMYSRKDLYAEYGAGSFCAWSEASEKVFSPIILFSDASEHVPGKIQNLLLCCALV